MPVYEYVCPKCKKHVELIRKFSQAHDPVPCDACGGGQEMEKIISGTAQFHLKGEGFHSPGVSSKWSMERGDPVRRL